MVKYNENTLNTIRLDLNRQESERLSPRAALSAHAARRFHEKQLDSEYRQDFSLDVDRILHSLAYTRYIDKTQVFYLIKNDHITHRVLHVQLVSKVARTIGRFLRLNEDLIEAIALGHDIGHTPFGHDGEGFLSELCQKSGIGYFQHCVQSVQFLDKVERKGHGWNLCLQTLDGILCHDGEIHNQTLEPTMDKTFENHKKEVIQKKHGPTTDLIPMTMEGCVARMADTISYIGRDIEDAVRLNLIKRSDLHTAFSLEVSAALKKLKEFNLERIYMNPKIKKHTGTIKKLFPILFEKYLEDIETENHSSVIFTSFLHDMAEEYLANHNKEEIVRDFIAGMTDQYFLRQCPKDMIPETLDA